MKQHWCTIDIYYFFGWEFKIRFSNDGGIPLKIFDQRLAILKTTIVELRDTIWAMNANEFDDLSLGIYNFIEKSAIGKENTAFKFSVDDQLKK